MEEVYPDYIIRWSWYKGFTVLFVIVLGIADIFFSIASIYDGMSRNTFLVGPYFVSYVVVVGVLGLMVAIFYALYFWQMQRGDLYTLLYRRDYREGEFFAKQMGMANSLYPRYVWEFSTFFTATFVIYIFLLGMWARFIVNQGYNYTPNFNLAINDEGLLEYYLVQFSMAVLSFVAFVYCVDFLWLITVPGGLYPLTTLSTIRRMFGSQGTTNVQYDPKTGRFDYGGTRTRHYDGIKKLEPNPGNTWYPGASKWHRKGGHQF